MKKQIHVWLAALCALAGLNSPAFAQDTHIAAGADDNGKLELVSGYLSSAVYHMVKEPVGRHYAGYYALGDQPRTQFPREYFSFIALSDGYSDDAQEHHASTGADIWLEITSVSGPTGSTFGFWESAWSYDPANVNNIPTKSFLANTATGGYKFEISEPLSFRDLEDQDPYGHIHERGWTVNQPGDYYIGFTLYDLSTVGPGGGPIHTPSQTYIFHFLAVPEPGSLPLLLAGILPCALRPRRRRAPCSSLSTPNSEHLA